MNDQSTSELDFIKGLLIDAIRAADAIPKPALNLWFAHLKIESISDSTAILAVENEFISKKIQERYADVLADYLSEIVGYRLFVQMSVDETLVPAPRGGTYIRPFNAMEGKMPEADDDEDEDEEEEEQIGSGGGHGEKAPEEDEKPSLSEAEMRELWDEISEYVQTDMETMSKQQGDEMGDLMQNLTAVNRDKYDYTDFLRKFSVHGEQMQINDDEFDYIFYTYGLSLYKNMPLIEPLEYKEVKKVKEFVVAIDTSGSVSGELVRKFVEKTYNILKSEESFFTKINLHIIQCDSEIHEDVKITNQEDFDRYMDNLTLKGFGGTDFRPVFEYVDKLIKNHEFSDLKGLIYFTDGWGTFPRVQPEYSTAFVFLDDNYNNPSVPVWAIKLVLTSEEI